MGMLPYIKKSLKMKNIKWLSYCTHKMAPYRTKHETDMTLNTDTADSASGAQKFKLSAGLCLQCLSSKSGNKGIRTNQVRSSMRARHSVSGVGGSCHLSCRGVMMTPTSR
jgi:hypothetical protein